MGRESLFEFCGNVPLLDRRNHRRLAGFFQDVLSFRGEEEFDEIHCVLPILGRSRHGGRIPNCVAQIDAGREADDIQFILGGDGRRVIYHPALAFPSLTARIVSGTELGFERFTTALSMIFWVNSGFPSSAAAFLRNSMLRFVARSFSPVTRTT
jgi:hypothetical protein